MVNYFDYANYKSACKFYGASILSPRPTLTRSENSDQPIVFADLNLKLYISPWIRESALTVKVCTSKLAWFPPATE
jgi:hypothetical protein